MTLELIRSDADSIESLRGETRHDIRRRLAKGTLIRLHTDWDLTAEEHEALYFEESHLLTVIATTRRMLTEEGVVAYGSAVTVHGLPLWRTVLGRVHVTLCGGGLSRSSKDVFRHRDALAEEDIETVRGIRVTTLERTVVDAIRVLRPEAAIAVVDAAMRQVAWDPETGAYHDAAAERFRDRLWERLSRMRGQRGIRQARVMVELADGRAESPGESVMRLYLLILGYARPRLQIEVEGPAGSTFRVDGELMDAGFFYEFDGEAKYSDPELMGGRTREQILAQQQWRQDWIEATTGRPFTRCGTQHLESPAALAAKLREDGVPLPLAHVLPIGVFVSRSKN